MFIYWILLFVLLCSYCIDKWLVAKFAKKIEKYDKKITYKEMMENVIKYLNDNELDTIKLECGEKYCFDMIRNVLKIKKKKHYSRYDMFISYHEIGHIIDFNNHYNGIYKLIVTAKLIFYLLWISILCIRFGINIIGTSIQLLNLFGIIVGLFVLITTVITEYHASNHAINFFEHFSIIQELKKLVKLSIIEQGLYWAIMVLPLMLILCFFS